MDVSTLTAKGQVTVPKEVREALGLRQGDQLSWELEDGSVRVRAIAPLDLAYLRSLDASLQEWSSPADEEALAGLWRRLNVIRWFWCRSHSRIAPPRSARQTGKTALSRHLFPEHHYVTPYLPSEAAAAEHD